jgi:hypothetical protein
MSDLLGTSVKEALNLLPLLLPANSHRIAQGYLRKRLWMCLSNITGMQQIDVDRGLGFRLLIREQPSIVSNHETVAALVAELLRCAREGGAGRVWFLKRFAVPEVVHDILDVGSAFRRFGHGLYVCLCICVCILL